MASFFERFWRYLTNAAPCPGCGGRGTHSLREETVEMFNRRSYRIPAFMVGRSTGTAFNEMCEERWRGIEHCKTCGHERSKVWTKTYED